MYVEADDLRQILVITKNEIRKFIRGKRLLIYVVIAAAMFILASFLPYIFNESWHSAIDFLSTHLGSLNILVIIAVTLFASSTYVSEFEERTALILFTRPVKKTTIFIGKFIGCFIMEAVVLMGYYVAIGVTFPFFDDGPAISGYIASFGTIILFLFAASALASVFSVTMKKAGTAAIMTFVTMFLLISIISGSIYLSTGEMPWYMLDYAYYSVFLCIPNIDNLLIDFELVYGILTMIMWGAVATILSWVLFIRKEM
ncbi:MAG: ABC transporter permease [Methanomassiliicoccaceae archaeon]|nr:ABC transporter permease [Methanomassiliicoccaceae archaeon]